MNILRAVCVFHQCFSSLYNSLRVKF